MPFSSVKHKEADDPQNANQKIIITELFAHQPWEWISGGRSGPSFNDIDDLGSLQKLKRFVMTSVLGEA